MVSPYLERGLNFSHHIKRLTNKNALFVSLWTRIIGIFGLCVKLRADVLAAIHKNVFKTKALKISI
jgi:hypothetical protein